MLKKPEFPPKQNYRQVQCMNSSRAQIRVIKQQSAGTKFDSVSLNLRHQITRMSSSEIQGRLYEQSDCFLNPLINPGRLSIPDQKQPDSGEMKSAQIKLDKSKGIVKQPKSSLKRSKAQKGRKDEVANTKMGRPSNQGNQGIEKNHLAINRSFNDIVYHFSRFMIFLKLKQDQQTSLHAMQLQNYQSAWMSQAQAIMSLQNFPEYEQQKPTFLLHPNSLHFVFDYRFQKQHKVDYNQEEVKYMLMAFLKKRKMLTTTIYHYVSSYWEDIVKLVNNPKGSDEPEDEVLRKDQSAEVGWISSGEIENGENQTERKDKSTNKGRKEVSELQNLKKELAEDDSIAAYEMACYLHACCLKYQLRVTGGH